MHRTTGVDNSRRRLPDVASYFRLEVTVTPKNRSNEVDSDLSRRAMERARGLEITSPVLPDPELASALGQERWRRLGLLCRNTKARGDHRRVLCFEI